MNREQVLNRLDKAWTAFRESYAGLPDDQITGSPVKAKWSVKDVLAHVTTWEEEALKYLPLTAEGGRPPRYATLYGGIDAFNALTTDRKRGLPLVEVLRQLDQTHLRLVDYLQTVPEELLTRETPFRRRLRLDAYGHYPRHAKAILEWRKRLAQ